MQSSKCCKGYTQRSTTDANFVGISSKSNRCLTFQQQSDGTLTGSRCCRMPVPRLLTPAARCHESPSHHNRSDRSGSHSVGDVARPGHNLYLDRRRRVFHFLVFGGQLGRRHCARRRASGRLCLCRKRLEYRADYDCHRRREQLPGRADSNIQRECQRSAYDPNRLRQFPLPESVKLRRDDHLRGPDGRHTDHCRKQRRIHSAKR